MYDLMMYVEGVLDVIILAFLCVYYIRYDKTKCSLSLCIIVLSDCTFKRLADKCRRLILIWSHKLVSLFPWHGLFDTRSQKHFPVRTHICITTVFIANLAWHPNSGTFSSTYAHIRLNNGLHWQFGLRTLGRWQGRCHLAKVTESSFKSWLGNTALPLSQIKSHQQAQSIFLTPHSNKMKTTFSQRFILKLMVLLGVLSVSNAFQNLATDGKLAHASRTLGQLNAWSMPMPTPKATWYDEVNPTARRTVYDE
jgi:hypothetical protein